MVVVDLLDVPLVAHGLDRTYAHLLLIVVVVALLLADEQLVAVTREIRRGLDDLIRSFHGGDRRCGRSFPRCSLRLELVLLRYRRFLGFLLTFVNRVGSSDLTLSPRNN